MNAMTRRVLTALLLCAVPGGTALAWTSVPYAPPAVVNEPDCPSAFMMDVHHRHNPATPGSLTRDGYPVMLRANGKPWHIMPQGMPLPDPVVIQGYPHADFSPGPGPAAFR